MLTWLNHSNFSIPKGRPPRRSMTFHIATEVGKSGDTISLAPVHYNKCPASNLRPVSIPLFSIASYVFAYGNAGLNMYFNILYWYKILKYKVLGIEVKLVIMSNLFIFPRRKMRLKDIKTLGSHFIFISGIWPVTNNISQCGKQLQIMSLCSPLNN